MSENKMSKIKKIISQLLSITANNNVEHFSLDSMFNRPTSEEERKKDYTFWIIVFALLGGGIGGLIAFIGGFCAPFRLFPRRAFQRIGYLRYVLF